MSIGNKPEKNLLIFIRRRLFATLISFAIVSIFALVTTGLILNLIGVESIQGFKAILLIVIGYGLSTYMLICLPMVYGNGYTIGSYIMGVRVVQKNGKCISFSECFKRIFAMLRQIIHFYWFTHVKFNSKGEFYYDEEFGFSVKDKKEKFKQDSRKEIKYFEYNFLKIFFITIIYIFSFLTLISFLLDLLFRK